MKSTYPEANSNVSDYNIEVIALPTIAMYRFETIFDTLAEEPNTMTLREKASGKSVLLEDIFRLRIWRRKGITRSWSLYADDRETPKYIILRSVVWDMDKDMQDIIAVAGREQILNSWPEVAIKNICLQAKDCRRVFSAVQRIDRHISGGITFDEAEKPSWEWRDIELMRNYDWGQVHATWNPTRRNTFVEEEIQLLSDLFSGLEQEKNNMGQYTLELNYRADWKLIWANYKDGISMETKTQSSET